MPFDVVGLGLCAWDTLLLFEEYPGPDQKVEALNSICCGGGPVPTALAVFSKLGGKAVFLGAVGDRQDGLKIRADLERYGVDVANLLVRPGGRSPCAYIWVDVRNGARTVVLDKGDLEDIQSDELPEEVLRSTSLLLIDGRCTEVCIRAAEICRSGGGEVVIDAGSPRREWEALLKISDHAVVSRDFVEGTFPGASPEAALKIIRDHGPQCAVITLGEEGGIWMDRDGLGRYAVFTVSVVDSTGAGDAFHGAYLYGLKRGWDLDKRCRFSSAVAALVCRGLGGRTCAPDYEEVLQFVSENRGEEKK